MNCKAHVTFLNAAGPGFRCDWHGQRGPPRCARSARGHFAGLRGGGRRLTTAHSRHTAFPPSKKRARRRTDEDIRRGRETRGRQAVQRRALVAVWNGAILAESRDYEFMDGRFWFPAGDVRWELLRESGATRHHNPVGLTRLYDVEVRRGRRVARNRRAAARFDDTVKKPWETLRGFTFFWKGVDVRAKREGEGEEGGRADCPVAE